MKISLIIPTRERATLFRHCIQTALAIEDDQIEIVVCDNFSQDGTPDIVASISDPRVVKVRSNRRLSMRQNFENGLAHSTGDYVCFIGDDDGFLPRQFPFARHILQKHQPDTMAYSLLRYAWPGAGSRRKEGTLRLERPRVFGAVSEVDLAEMKRRVLSARVNWYEGWPDIYHGFVSRRWIESRRAPGADFFLAKIPDIFFAYLALLTDTKHIFVPHSFTISGFSTASTGGSFQQATTNEVSDSPAQRFEQEAQTDPVSDRINLGFGVPSALFATLVQVSSQVEAARPDYASWFSYLIRSSKTMEERQRRTLLERLEAFALGEGLAAEWADATGLSRRFERATYRFSSENLARLTTRARNKFDSFRVSAHPYGDLSINGACRAVDASLAGLFGEVLDGKITTVTAWKRAKTYRKSE